jgi:hypothetical protein
MIGRLMALYALWAAIRDRGRGAILVDLERELRVLREARRDAAMLSLAVGYWYDKRAVDQEDLVLKALRLFGVEDPKRWLR